MARRNKSLLRLDAVRVEGALIQPDILATAASGAAEDQSAASYGIERGLNLRDEIGRAYLIAKGLWAIYQEGRGGSSREAALWGMATDGLTWRILRDNESITRPGYIEIDLARIFRDDLYSDFSAFWL